MIEVAAGFVAWLGASMVVLADGRRGLALGVAIATLGLAVLVLQDAGPLPLRFAVLTVTGLAGARVLLGADAPALLTSVVLLALAIGAAAGLGDAPLGAWPYVAAGAVAAGACWVPVRVARAA